MTNPAVVILTDPARFQLAEAETLVQALLQVQQLNNSGVPASQAFCDNPAAAMGFIEAYSKVYPALQLQTSDLPLPQHLYSMMADSRLSPLRLLEAAETAKPDQPGEPYPLYVLSLGAPEALMQALQYNQLANSSIRVLEIAPLGQAKAEPVSVAEAVAAASRESSRAHDRVDHDAPETEQLTENSVKLSSVEVDLDRIEIDSAGERQSYNQTHQVQGDPAPAITTAAAGPAPSSTSVGRQTTVEAPASSIGIPEPTSQATGAMAAPYEAATNTRQELPTDPPGTGITRSDAPLVSAEPPGGDGADTPYEPAPSDMEPTDPPVGGPGEQDPTTGCDDPMRLDSPPVQEDPEVEDAAAAGPSVPESEGGDAFAGYSCTFAMPGEDVFYQPTSSFSSTSDLCYALPADDAGVPSFALFDQSTEVVDLEAMYTDLLEPAAEGKAVCNGFDSILMRAPNLDPGDPKYGPRAYLEGDASVTHDDPEPDKDGTIHDVLTSVHDANI